MEEQVATVFTNILGDQFGVDETKLAALVKAVCELAPTRETPSAASGRSSGSAQAGP